MSKSKSKNETKTTVDPRERMKEIRAEVKTYVDGANPGGLEHLGELPENMEDAVRVIIALQDLLEKSMVRHKKASDNILELRHFMEQEALNNLKLFSKIMVDRSKDKEEIKSLKKENEEITENNDAIVGDLIEFNDKLVELSETTEAVKRERDTLLETVAILSHNRG